MAPLTHSHSFCSFSICFNDHIYYLLKWGECWIWSIWVTSLLPQRKGITEPFFVSSYHDDQKHSGWVLIQSGQISLEMRHSQPFPEIFKLESFLQGHPRSTMGPHSLSLSLVFTFTRSNMLFFFHSQNNLVDTVSSSSFLFWTKKRGGGQILSKNTLQHTIGRT